jgi:hypothetical protein
VQTYELKNPLLHLYCTRPLCTAEPKPIFKPPPDCKRGNQSPQARVLYAYIYYSSTFLFPAPPYFLIAASLFNPGDLLNQKKEIRFEVVLMQGQWLKEPEKDDGRQT